MRGVYVANVQISALVAAKTLMYITAPSSAVVEILSASVTNETNETNEQLNCCLQTVNTLGTPTATTLTPSKTEAGSSSATSTVKGNVTASEPTYVSNTQIGILGFSSLAGWFYNPLPEERPVIAPSATWGLRLLTATNTAVDAVVSITFREIG